MLKNVLATAKIMTANTTAQLQTVMNKFNFYRYFSALQIKFLSLLFILATSVNFAERYRIRMF